MSEKRLDSTSKVVLPRGAQTEIYVNDLNSVTIKQESEHLCDHCGEESDALITLGPDQLRSAIAALQMFYDEREQWQDGDDEADETPPSSA